MVCRTLFWPITWTIYIPAGYLLTSIETTWVPPVVTDDWRIWPDMLMSLTVIPDPALTSDTFIVADAGIG
jgi:hypothetical protein